MFDSGMIAPILYKKVPLHDRNRHTQHSQSRLAGEGYSILSWPVEGKREGRGYPYPTLASGGGIVILFWTGVPLLPPPRTGPVTGLMGTPPPP